MARIPMRGDPATLKEIVAQYGSPLEKIVEIHRDIQNRLADAEAKGDQEEAKDLRCALKQSQKLMDDYGLLK